MTSRLFWKLFVALSIVNIIAIYGIWTLATSWDASGQTLVLFVGFVLILTLCSTFVLVSQIVQPVQKLTQAAESMAIGKYNEPIYVASKDELGQLARKFNEMRQEMDAQLALMRDTNQRLSTVLGGMSDGVIAIDQDQLVLFANRSAGELMGFSPIAAQGKSLLESVRSHTLHDLVVRLLVNPGEKQIEIAWGDEQQRALQVIATSFAGDPSAGVVMMIHSLSEQRRLEAMRRDFVANVSHELKTPLSSIKAYAETLSEGAINDQKYRGKFVAQIEEQADRLSQLITDLLSLARIEQGRHLMEFQPVPILRVIELCVNEQRRSAESKEIDLRVKQGESVAVVADEDGLRQILINLIDNAIKYTPNHGNVSVGWTIAGKMVAVFVQDTGIGIPEEMQSRVFERFFRVDKARSRELGGTGLGLAIVKHLSQSFGGSVEVHSKMGEGSRFVVKLPRA